MPGAVHPRSAPRPHSHRSESEVYAALCRGLPDSWTAWHSLRLRIDNAWEGEGDFVIACPDRGVLVLEVKGGRVECHDGHWMQGGHEMKKPPREQALSFVRNLVQAIENRGGRRPPYGVACVFPDVEFSVPPSAGDLDGVVLGRRAFNDIGPVLRTVFGRAVPCKPVPLPNQWIPMLHDLWGDTWVPHVRLADKVEDAEQRAVALNSDQLEILDIAGDNPRTLVEGSAGTGKTVVARELCARAGRAGKRALYLCFTDALARAVDRSLSSERLKGADVSAVPIRRFARDLMERSGRPLPSDETEAWREVSLLAACESLPPRAERPQLVVIDEAQDLDDADWEFVNVLSRDAELWAFLDESQRFWADRKLPKDAFASATRLRLRRQMRNPPGVAAFAVEYAKQSMAAEGKPKNAPKSEDVLLRVAPESEQLEAIRREIDRLMKEKVHAHDIAVLSLAGMKRSRLNTLSRIGSHTVVRADTKEAASSVIADTFLRFKGLDRAFVILTDVDLARGDQYDTRMHIAVSRATVGVTIVCSDGCVEADPRLAARR